jgi:hypothetical protein
MVLQPESCNAGRLAQDSFGLVPVRSPLLGESRLISFPEGTEMFQFPSFAAPRLCIQQGAASTFLDAGFPIRRSTGRRLLTAHRRLSQFCHVLLRLLVPRHPPNALTSLTTETFASRYFRDAPAAGQVMSTVRLCRRARVKRAAVVSTNATNPRRSAALARDFAIYRLMRTSTSLHVLALRSSIRFSGRGPASRASSGPGKI